MRPFLSASALPVRREDTMKNANGYGSITKLKGNRRKPWMVRITTGKDENGSPIRKVLGYYSSNALAVAALSDFNREPYDVASRKLTFKDIYEQWKSTKEYQELSGNTQKQYKTAFNDYALLQNKTFVSIKISDLQRCIDRNNSGYTARRYMKNLASKLYHYSLCQEIVTQNKAELLNIGMSSAVQKEKVPYSDEEIDILWSHTNDDYVKIILIYIYTGVRCNELLYLKKENLHISEQYFDVVKSKTASGIRSVPIADVIVPLFNYFVSKSMNKWVFTTEQGIRLTDTWYRKKQSEVLKALNMQHTTHEARHTCITQLTVHNVNPSVIKEIVGHKAAKSFTERVYTHIYMKTKIEAVNTIHT